MVRLALGRDRLMSSFGRDVRNGEMVELEFRDGLIHRRAEAVPGADQVPADPFNGRTPLPGMLPGSPRDWIDLQINGWAGVDYNDDQLESTGLEAMCRSLARRGTTRHLATIITASPEAMLRRIRALRRLREDSPFLSRRIIGLHIEGPYHLRG